MRLSLKSSVNRYKQTKTNNKKENEGEYDIGPSEPAEIEIKNMETWNMIKGNTDNGYQTINEMK